MAVAEWGCSPAKARGWDATRATHIPLCIVDMGLSASPLALAVALAVALVATQRNRRYPPPPWRWPRYMIGGGEAVSGKDYCRCPIQAPGLMPLAGDLLMAGRMVVCHALSTGIDRGRSMERTIVMSFCVTNFEILHPCLGLERVSCWGSEYSTLSPPPPPAHTHNGT